MSESNAAPQISVRLQAGCCPIGRRSFERHGPPCCHLIYHGAQCGHTLLAARCLSDQPCVGGVLRCRLRPEFRACNLSAAGGQVTRKAGDRCGTMWNIELCLVFDHPHGAARHVATRNFIAPPISADDTPMGNPRNDVPPVPPEEREKDPGRDSTTALNSSQSVRSIGPAIWSLASERSVWHVCPFMTLCR